MNLPVEDLAVPDSFTPSLLALEERVRKLEEKVAAIPATTASEESIVEKVTERIQAQMPEMPPPPPTVDLRMVEAVLGKQSWLIVEIFRDLRNIFAMFFDIRFKVGWGTRVLTIVLLVLIFLSGVWFPLSWTPGIGWIFDKTLDLILAFVMVKALLRESHRYQQIRTHLRR